MEVATRVNGREVVRDVAPQELLLDFLRDSLGLTGAKRSCDVQVCGACTVLVDGVPVSSLLEHDELGADEEEIKRRLAGNLCRCTGYRGIVEAVADLAAR